MIDVMMLNGATQKMEIIDPDFEPYPNVTRPLAVDEHGELHVLYQTLSGTCFISTVDELWRDEDKESP